MAGLLPRWTHLSPFSASIPNTTNPSLHPYQNPADLRSSSTASLLPPPSAVEDIRTGRSTARTLLCVFIHGFVGDETSFRSFPAHFHELLTILVQDTHVVHTKVYPKFKTRDRIGLAVANFSRWLSQFESPTTDIVLLGHSMGGLLAADTVLLAPLPPGRHRILGHVSFDTPFIGIHPGVVKSGLASLFKPAEKPLPDPRIPTNIYNSSRTSTDSSNSIATSSSSSSAASIMSTSSTATFTPPSVAPKKKLWQSGLDFWNKHQGGVRRAALAYVNGHLEFSGALLDFTTMRARYERVRALERPDITDRRRMLFGESARENGVYVPRVRFVNYYTVSTGRPKQKPATPPAQARTQEESEIPDANMPEIRITPSPPNLSRWPSPDDDKSGYSKVGVAEASQAGSPPPPSTSGQTRKPEKERTFCITPHGKDSCWAKVQMENVDEVGAHCGLFFINGVPAPGSPEGSPGAAEGEYDGSGSVESRVYERLLGDVTQRIEGWCREWIDEMSANPAASGDYAQEAFGDY
ncbi:hypothetical protein DRE_01066 [Drechslerella stenobrocha 248]|uniref:DUF676 domain-containing protein n=1 Tax=Drechslerella stenobrocha 248 TaxID=1043628 RepID=W7I661_9PEZI|nr:hypothetical protein DRE_01066 [Drechslerella stenobrocha 248]